MATGATTQQADSSGPGLTHKIRRELARPMRRLSQYLYPVEAAPTPGYLTGTGSHFAGFHPQQATVEPEGIPLLQQLVKESAEYPGPIIEVGTLIGITTTTMALAKRPEQKIITVDMYCWNPWGLKPDVHAALAAEILRYLVEAGHVERVHTDKNEFYEAYRGPAPAMVFLDAIHDYAETKKDIEWAKRIGAKIIAGHDYCEQFSGVQQIVDEFGGPRRLAGSVWAL